MKNKTYIAFTLALLITISSLVLWQVTGGDYYTKFEVVKQLDVEINADDPLAGTGFYENESQKHTVVQRDFRFGLFPTPSRLLDKHALSVLSVLLPVWAVTIGFVWIYRRRERASR